MRIRRAGLADLEALARIPAGMAAPYAELNPERFREPDLDGFAGAIAGDLEREGGTSIDLVADLDGEVVAWLYARLVEPDEHARYAYPRDVSERRLAIEYLATLA